MENTTISLVLSVFAAIITGLKFFIDILTRKEVTEDKFAKNHTVNSEFSIIKKDIIDIENKLEDHGAKIGQLHIQGAVLNSQVSAQLRELEKLGNKIDEWRNNE